ncbi:MAG TPA: hypothetical protein VNH18_10725, partial [Bryobacteraceae bacterium]|nr:hypothetical protein [Bryobacteraceae bacterium]
MKVSLVERNAYETALSQFLESWPEYVEFEQRAAEYGRLDASGQVYLDYTGGSLYAASQLRGHAEFLAEGVFGNPHSANRASAAMTAHVESARRYLLRYFNADPKEYLAVFTMNASGALKLLGEAFPFSPERRLLMSFDNHNSVNGMREFALARGAGVEYSPMTVPGLRMDL